MIEWIYTVWEADRRITQALAEKLDLLYELSRSDNEEVMDRIKEKNVEIEELTKIRESLYQLFR